MLFVHTFDLLILFQYRFNRHGGIPQCKHIIFALTIFSMLYIMFHHVIHLIKGEVVHVYRFEENMDIVCNTSFSHQSAISHIDCWSRQREKMELVSKLKLDLKVSIKLDMTGLFWPNYTTNRHRYSWLRDTKSHTTSTSRPYPTSTLVSTTRPPHSVITAIVLIRKPTESADVRRLVAEEQLTDTTSSCERDSHHLPPAVPACSCSLALPPAVIHRVRSSRWEISGRGWDLPLCDMPWWYDVVARGVGYVSYVDWTDGALMDGEFMLCLTLDIPGCTGNCYSGLYCKQCISSSLMVSLTLAPLFLRWLQTIKYFHNQGPLIDWLIDCSHIKTSPVCKGRHTTHPTNLRANRANK